MDHTVADRERADALLVLRCQLGERQAFDALIHRWSAPLHRYALKLCNDSDLAHDLTQEVWLRVLLRHGAWASSGRTDGVLRISFMVSRLW